METLKYCSGCEGSGRDPKRSVFEFGQHKRSKDGLQHRCRECLRAEGRERCANPEFSAKKKIYYKKYREDPKHTTLARKRAAEWRDSNPEKNRENVDSWMKKHKDERRVYHANYQRNRRETDLNFKLRCLLRGRLTSCLRSRKKGKKYRKAGSAVKDLGCSIDLLISNLESKFAEGMSWGNHGTHWELDHIQPLMYFDLTDRKQFLVACNYKNLQPLWIKDHLEKTTRELSERCENSIGQ